MNLLLISNTPIIIKIFKLVCKKLDLELFVQSDYNVQEKKDFIIIDQEYIDDRFNSLKKFCSKLGAICNDELPFEKARDFIIPRPFLPLQLQEIIKEQLEFIDEEETLKKQENIKNTAKYSAANMINDDSAEDLTNYVESLADNIASDIEDENDESIVTLATLNSGGVLDNNELSKISDILRYDNIQNEFVNSEKETDWKELSDIIDDALNEVGDYDIANNQPLKLILNKYSIDELKPLLEKFDQNVIDKLSNGEDIDLKLTLKDNN
ncbi:hypothetical protein CPG37_09865 [Malaciobacter canalis]|uniref:Uncharacterized protein n=1 Tax=Malaciobacter canalis TaxID=1912871 RepID=A0ABX4LN97_9BACT|nr:hypothetical protein [Malaciobacter canalis]PHO09364.1 hypothetical protein CPG37_09865 [Malaciobacter canalis]QEE32177.1 hypothetical protein ACAN_0685 [Malaciobacter canalis]